MFLSWCHPCNAIDLRDFWFHTKNARTVLACSCQDWTNMSSQRKANARIKMFKNTHAIFWPMGAMVVNYQFIIITIIILRIWTNSSWQILLTQIRLLLKDTGSTLGLHLRFWTNIVDPNQTAPEGSRVYTGSTLNVLDKHCRPRSDCSWRIQGLHWVYT